MLWSVKLLFAFFWLAFLYRSRRSPKQQDLSEIKCTIPNAQNQLVITDNVHKPLPLSGLTQQTTNWRYLFFFQKTGFDIPCKL